jgi:hypothetical protein
MNLIFEQNQIDVGDEVEIVRGALKGVRGTYNDDDIIRFFIEHLKKLPNASEVKEIIKIYQS